MSKAEILRWLLTLPLLCFAWPDTLLLFSSYGHGSHGNGYLEVYNSGMNPADLRHVGLVFRNSQGAETWRALAATGELEPGGYYLISHPAADPLLLRAANETYDELAVGSTAYAIAVGQESAFTVLDSIGFFGEHSGMVWSLCGGVEITQPSTLLRKSRVVVGNGGNWSLSAGTNATDCEWLVFSRTDVDIVRSFCPTRPVAASIHDVRTNRDLLGEQVYVQGVISAVVSQRLVFLQEPSSIEELTGLWLRSTGGGALRAGDLVKVSGLVSDYLGLRFLAEASFAVQGKGEAPPAVVLEASAAQEVLWRYQGMLVQLDGVEVRDLDVEECRFRLGDTGDEAEEQLWAALATPPGDSCKVQAGQKLAIIQGPLHFLQGTYTLLPLDDCDVRLESGECLGGAAAAEGAQAAGVQEDADHLSIFGIALFCASCAAALGTVLGCSMRQRKHSDMENSQREEESPDIVIGRPIPEGNVGLCPQGHILTRQRILWHQLAVGGECCDECIRETCDGDVLWICRLCVYSSCESCYSHKASIALPFDESFQNAVVVRGTVSEGACPSAAVSC